MNFPNQHSDNKKNDFSEQEIAHRFRVLAAEVFVDDAPGAHLLNEILRTLFNKKLEALAHADNYIYPILDFLFKNKVYGSDQINDRFEAAKELVAASTTLSPDDVFKAKLIHIIRTEFSTDSIDTAYYKFKTLLGWLHESIIKNPKNKIKFFSLDLPEAQRDGKSLSKLLDIAEQQYTHPRVQGLVPGIDYALTDECIPANVLPPANCRVIKIKTIAGLRKAGGDMDVCLKDRKVNAENMPDRLDNIDYEDLLKRRFSQFFAIAKGVKGDITTLIQVDKAPAGSLAVNGKACRGIVVEAGQRQNSLVRDTQEDGDCLRYLREFVDANSFTYGSSHYRTGMVQCNRGLVPAYELQPGDVVNGHLQFKAMAGKDYRGRENIALNGVVINGGLYLEGSDIETLDNVSAHVIRVNACKKLKRIGAGVSCRRLVVSDAIENVPEVSQIGEVLFLDNGSQAFPEKKRDYTFSWAGFYSYNQRAYTWRDQREAQERLNAPDAPKLPVIYGPPYGLFNV